MPESTLLRTTTSARNVPAMYVSPVAGSVSFTWR